MTTTSTWVRGRTAHWGHGRLCIGVSSLILLSASVFSGEELPVLRVGSERDFRPFSFTDSKGQPTGFSVDLIKSVARQMGYGLEIRTGGWDELWNGLLAGELDVLPTVARTPGREPLVDFTVTHTETFDAFFRRAGEAAWRNLAAARGRQVVVLRSDAAHHQLLERQFEGEIVPVDSISEGLRRIAEGRHDAFLCSKLIGVLEREAAHIRGVKAGPPIPDYRRAFSFAVRKDHGDLLEKLNQGLLIVKTDGEYEELYGRWFAALEPWERFQRYFWPALAFLGILSCLGLGLVFVLNRMVRQRTRELVKANEEIRVEMAERQKAEIALQNLNETLEQRVNERTEALRQQRERMPIGCVVMDERCSFKQVNPAAEKILGYAEAELQGRDLATIVPEAARAHVESIWNRLAKGEMTAHSINENLTKDGRVLVCEWTNTPLYDRSGMFSGALCMLQDITERKRTEEALFESEESLRVAADRLSAVLHAQQQIASANLDYRGLLTLILGTMSDLTGADGASLEVPQGDEMVYEAATGMAGPFAGLRLPAEGSLSGSCMETGEMVRSDDSETDPRVERQACQRIGLRSMLLIPLRYDEHSLGVLKLMSSAPAAFDAGSETTLRLTVEFLSVTIGRKRAEEALGQSRRDLDRAQEVGQIGSWRLDRPRNLLTLSEQNCRIFGLPKGTPLPYETFLAAVHPDDRGYVDARWQSALKGAPFDFEHRIFVGGAVKWVREKAYLEFDAEGSLLGAFGISQDVTSRKAAEETVLWNSRRYEILSQTAARLLESANPQSLVEELCKRVMDLLDCHTFLNFLVDDSSDGQLKLNSYAGIDEAQAHQIAHLNPRVAVCGCAARDAQRMIVEDIGNSLDPCTELIHSFGIRAYCCHPLIVHDELIGTLSFGTRSRSRFSPEEVEVMHAVAHLVAMAMYRIRIEAALRASEERFRLLVEQTPDGIFVSDHHGNYVDVNAAGCELLGYDREEILKRSIAAVIAPEEVPRIAPEVARFALEAVTTSEWRFRRKDGSTFVGEVVARQLPDGRLQAILRDITERKKAEDATRASLLEKEVLLKEIHHRVKNNMQIISSLASLQARELHSPDAAVLTAFQDMTHRVRSMAMVHDRLYESPDLAHIDFSEYARALLDYLLRAYRTSGTGVRLELDMQPLRFPVDIAVPCGLVLNELATNALKHAFRGRERGRIAVSLRGDGAGGVRLNVRDDGVGVPPGFDWQNATSLGLRLVQMLSRQLRGQVALSQDGGTGFELAFELPGVREL